jgi:uncharacterized protein with PIN domain
MPVVTHCKEFKVPCAPDEESCQVCVLRIRAAEREEVRARVEARRRVLLQKVTGTDNPREGRSQPHYP